MLGGLWSGGKKRMGLQEGGKIVGGSKQREGGK